MVFRRFLFLFVLWFFMVFESIVFIVLLWLFVKSIVVFAVFFFGNSMEAITENICFLHFVCGFSLGGDQNQLSTLFQQCPGIFPKGVFR